MKLNYFFLINENSLKLLEIKSRKLVHNFTANFDRACEKLPLTEMSSSPPRPKLV